MLILAFPLKAHRTYLKFPPFPGKACPPLLANIDARNHQSLNGTWNAMIEPTVFSLNDIMHFAERNYQGGPGELVEVNLENGLTLQVPGRLEYPR